MTYRGDDEYDDPDEYDDGKKPRDRRSSRASGRRRSNVLGSSGSGYRRAGGAPKPRSKKPFSAGSPSGGGGRARRNPANSSAAASARGRPARLSGSGKKRESRRRRDPSDRQQGDEKPDSGGRPGGWRARFARGRSKKQADRPSASRGRGVLTQAAAKVRGIKGRLRQRRDRTRDDDAARGRQDGQTDSRFRSKNAAYPKQSKQPAFGASRAAAPNRDKTRFARGAGSVQAAEPTGRRAAVKAPERASNDWLDLDRKLDLAGVGLVFGAIVLFFSTLSQEHAAISAVHHFIGQLLGWGAMAVPIAMFAAGMWLIVRHFGERPPAIDAVRLTGMALAFVAVLTLFQYLDSFSYAAAVPQAVQAQQVECAARTTGQMACWQELERLAECRMAVTSGCLQELAQYSYQRGQGGGYIGAWFYLTLVNNLTEVGGFVIVVMMLTFSMMMMTRSSMAEIAVAAVSIGRGFRSRMAQGAAKRRAQQLQAEQQATSLRVSKPPPAKLPGAAYAARALPEPAADLNMPIPSMPSSGQAFSSAELNQESIPVANQQNPSVVGRLLGRDKSKAAPPPVAPNQEPRSADSGLMGRILNRGDSKQAPPTQAQPETDADAVAVRPAVKRAPPNPPKAIPDELPAKPAFPARPPKRDEDEIDDQALGRPEDIPGHEIEKSPVPQSQAVRKSVSSRPSPPRLNWKLPDFRQLLASGAEKEVDHEQQLGQAATIEETLASFGAPGKAVSIRVGPAITQFGVEPGYLTSRSGKKSRVKVSAIAQLDKDLQLALGAKSIRVEAPVPGKGYVGIEVPNPAAALVSLRDVMESEDFQKIKSPLAVALGKAVDGTAISADLTQMPHLLIAGATGAGKSVCVNAIINSILATNSPETVKFIMVDPKRVELTGYNGLPHLMAPVVVEMERIVGVLKWVTREMDERYKKFSKVAARNIIDYNSHQDANLESMPYIVVIIDELADLMMKAPEETELAITRIAALARATGIHLVIATQRPSVNVVTGLIKANFPARIAFAVAGGVDSRVILDQPGAERLLGKGDMLYLSGNSPAPLRLQGVFVSDDEIDNIIRYWKTQRLENGTVSPTAEPSGQTAFWDMSPRRDMTGNSDSQEDELYQTAVDMVRRLDKASISLLQRRLRIGYTRAARLVDMMEERGVVGPPKTGSSKPRDVLPK